MIRDFTKTMIRVGDRVTATYERDPRFFGVHANGRDLSRLQRVSRGRAKKSSWKNRELVEDKEWTVVEVSPKALLVESYNWRRLNDRRDEVDIIWVSKLRDIKPVYAQMGVGRYRA